MLDVTIINKKTIYKISMVVLCANLFTTVIFAQGNPDDRNGIIYVDISTVDIKIDKETEEERDINGEKELQLHECETNISQPKEKEIQYYDDEEFIRIIYKDWLTRDSYIEWDGNGFEVIKYVSTMPEDLIVDLQYNEYKIFEHYGLIKSGSANIREGAGKEYSIVKKAYFNQKYGIKESKIIKKVENGEDEVWHKLNWYEDDILKEGYISSTLIERRSFRFEEYYDKLISVEKSLNIEKNAYVNNRFYRNGYAPRYNGKDIDNFGAYIYHAAPAYYEPDNTSDFRYIQDGAVVNVLEELNYYYRVESLNFDGEYFIPKRYLNFDSINELSMVIFIDRKYQNEVIFEKKEDHWNLISHTFATTGDTGKYKYPTDLGVYKIIEKKRIMLYLDDITKKLQGYAPYASRFSGGSYIHGIPINYIFTMGTQVLTPEVLDGEGNVVTEAVTRTIIINKKDPGEREFSLSIGTNPLSHKCVRNYTSHAIFIYERSVIGKTSVIVYE